MNIDVNEFTPYTDETEPTDEFIGRCALLLVEEVSLPGRFTVQVGMWNGAGWMAQYDDDSVAWSGPVRIVHGYTFGPVLCNR